jgi:hypothetical protein
MKRDKRSRRERRPNGRTGQRNHSRPVLERVADRVAVAVIGAVGRLARRLGPA